MSAIQPAGRRRSPSPPGGGAQRVGAEEVESPSCRGRRRGSTRTASRSPAASTSAAPMRRARPTAAAPSARRAGSRWRCTRCRLTARRRRATNGAAGRGRPVERDAARAGIASSSSQMIGQRGAGDGQRQRGEVGKGEAQVAPPDQRQRVAEGGAALRRQAARGEEAGDDEEDLHGDARVVVEPVDRPGQRRRAPPQPAGRRRRGGGGRSSCEAIAFRASISGMRRMALTGSAR